MYLFMEDQRDFPFVKMLKLIQSPHTYIVKIKVNLSLHILLVYWNWIIIWLWISSYIVMNHIKQ